EQKDFGERMFDIYNPNSFVAKAIMQRPQFASLSNISLSLSTLPASVFGLFGSAFSSFLPHASAVGTFDYDYGVGVYGFSNAVLENELYADPYENADKVENEYGLE